jgi:carbonic anhydrase
MRNLWRVVAAAACIGGSCYVGPPRFRSGVAGPEFRSRTASGFERLQAAEHEDPSRPAAGSWGGALALGLALGLLAAVLGGPQVAVAEEQAPDTAALFVKLLDVFDDKIDKVSKQISTLTDEVQEIKKENVRIDRLEKEVLDIRKLLESRGTAEQEMLSIRKVLESRTSGSFKKPTSLAWSHTDIPSWSKGYPMCAASAQSPINISTNGVDTNNATDSLSRRLKYMAVGGREIVHNGHVMQVNGSFGTFGLPDGEYEVKQFHFHFPAEHEVDGKLAAGELHIVHQRKGATGTDGLAVVGIILEENDKAAFGKPETQFLAMLGFGKELPKEGGKQELTMPVDLNAFADQIGGGFYHYEGSLTTPPCAEKVHWYVAKKAAYATTDFIKTFKESFSYKNNRPEQPVNQRPVVLNDVDVDGEFGGAKI